VLDRIRYEHAGVVVVQPNCGESVNVRQVRLRKCQVLFSGPGSDGSVGRVPLRRTRWTTQISEPQSTVHYRLRNHCSACRDYLGLDMAACVKPTICRTTRSGATSRVCNYRSEKVVNIAHAVHYAECLSVSIDFHI
jgi:hypothetical protein